MSIPTKAQIFHHWKNSDEIRIIDWFEPSCWACGEWWGGHYDLDIETLGTGEKVLNKVWNVVPLQRCHIIPKSLGGSDEVENLVLLCAPCHDLAPNTRSRDLFIKWVNNQGPRKVQEIKLAISSFDLNDEQLKVLNAVMLSSEFKKWSKGQFGLHWNQAYGGARLTLSTFLAGAIEFARVNELFSK